MSSFVFLGNTAIFTLDGDFAMTSFTITLLMMFGPQSAECGGVDAGLQVPAAATTAAETTSPVIEGVDLDRSRLEYISRLA